jgi:hypothetical protein
VKISVPDGIENMKICPLKIETVGAALANAMKELLPPRTMGERHRDFMTE